MANCQLDKMKQRDTDAEPNHIELLTCLSCPAIEPK